MFKQTVSSNFRDKVQPSRTQFNRLTTTTTTTTTTFHACFFHVLNQFRVASVFPTHPFFDRGNRTQFPFQLIDSSCNNAFHNFTADQMKRHLDKKPRGHAHSLQLMKPPGKRRLPLQGVPRKALRCCFLFVRRHLHVFNQHNGNHAAFCAQRCDNCKVGFHGSVDFLLGHRVKRSFPFGRAAETIVNVIFQPQPQYNFEKTLKQDQKIKPQIQWFDGQKQQCGEVGLEQTKPKRHGNAHGGHRTGFNVKTYPNGQKNDTDRPQQID